MKTGNGEKMVKPTYWDTMVHTLSDKKGLGHQSYGESEVRAAPVAVEDQDFVEDSEDDKKSQKGKKTAASSIIDGITEMSETNLLIADKFGAAVIKSAEIMAGQGSSSGMQKLEVVITNLAQQTAASMHDLVQEQAKARETSEKMITVMMKMLDKMDS